MTWTVSAALVALTAILLLPAQVGHRTTALVRVGRLAGNGRPPGAGEGRTTLGRAVLGLRLLDRPLPFATATGAACLGSVLLAGPAIGVEVLIVAAVGRLLVGDLIRSRRAAARLTELRAAVALLIAELEAGAPPPRALQAVAESSPMLRGALAGSAGEAHWRQDAAGVLLAGDDPDLRRLAVVWRVGETTGVPLSSVLSRLGADLASDAEQRRVVAVALAGPRSSAVLLSLLPLVGIGLGIAMGARPLPLLFASSGGRVLCCIGMLLDALGVLWVRRILRRARVGGRSRHRSDVERTSALALDLAAASLRGGRPVPEALVLAAPAADAGTAAVLMRVAGLLRLGSDPEQAWRAARDGPLAAVVTPAVRSSSSGARLAAAFERSASEIRTDCAADAAARAARAGIAAMGPLAACFLPSFVCLGIVPVVVGIARSALGVLP